MIETMHRAVCDGCGKTGEWDKQVRDLPGGTHVNGPDRQLYYCGECAAKIQLPAKGK